MENKFFIILEYLHKFFYTNEIVIEKKINFEGETNWIEKVRKG